MTNKTVLAVLTESLFEHTGRWAEEHARGVIADLAAAGYVIVSAEDGQANDVQQKITDRSAGA